MKKYILAISVVLSIVFNSISANDKKNNESNRLITGKVVDKNTGEEIVGAEIKIENTTIYSDLKGNFLTNVTSKKITATIEAISYNQSIITFETNHFTGELVISLESK